MKIWHLRSYLIGFYCKCMCFLSQNREFLWWLHIISVKLRPRWYGKTDFTFVNLSVLSKVKKWNNLQPAFLTIFVLMESNFSYLNVLIPDHLTKKQIRSNFNRFTFLKAVLSQYRLLFKSVGINKQNTLCQKDVFHNFAVDEWIFFENIFVAKLLKIFWWI